ncbi:MAG: hypothetical protein ACR2NZ_18780, partial [Rubripirellula sp.]
NHGLLLKDELIVPGQPDQSRLYQLITSTDNNSMPPSSRPALSADQIATVRRWIVAGAPAYPDDVIAKLEEPDSSSDVPLPPSDPVEKKIDRRDRDIMRAILSHVRSIPTNERSFIRFFSTRHLLRAGATETLLAKHRLALTKAINHLSYQVDLVVPTPIDETAGGTIFAVDIRKLGWHQKKLKAIDPEPANDGNALKLSLYDLILLEYPYAIHREDDQVSDAVTDEFLRVASQVRPIPFIRADWFCSVALQPPLYHDLMAMPATLEELEEKLGVDTKDNLRDGLAYRAGVTISGVSRNNRVVERHSQPSGYYWKSHDFASNTGKANILVDPINFKANGGEMIFRLPNGTQAYFVCNSNGDRIDSAPTSIVVDKFASDHVVRNGLGCIRCHDRGVKDFHDVVRPMLDILTSDPGFDRSAAKRLYPSHEKWEQIIAGDRGRFQAAMEALGMDPRMREPLSSLTESFMEQAIHAEMAASELGMADVLNSDGEVIRDATTQLSAISVSPGFTRLGLAPLAATGVIRRDTWEDNFDLAVRSLGLGTPIVPINGLQRADYLADDLSDKVVLRTNKANGLFEPGDEMRIFVDNKSSVAIEIDLFGTAASGKVVRLGKSGTEIKPGESFQFPEASEDAIEIRGGLGRETITLYASRNRLPSSVIFRGDNIADRVVHQSYVIRSIQEFDSPTIESDAAQIIKKTLPIETR